MSDADLVTWMPAAAPDIVRQVTSVYEPRRRAELRAKKAAEADESKKG